MVKFKKLFYKMISIKEEYSQLLKEQHQVHLKYLQIL